MAIRRLRGKAWGNALGGWKRQARDARGRFSSGRGGKSKAKTVARRKSSRRNVRRRRAGNSGRTLNRQLNTVREHSISGAKTTRRVVKTSASTMKIANSRNYRRRRSARVSHGRNMPIKSVSTYTDKQYADAWAAAETYQYDRRKTNRSIQGNHMGNIVALKTADYGGYAVGSALGAGAGVIGAPIAGMAGSAVLQYGVRRSLQKKGVYIGPQQFLAMNKHDQAAIAQRHNRIETLDAAANLAFTAYTVHSALRANGTYGRVARKVSARKAGNARAASHGLPRAGRGSAGNFQPKRAGRYGSNRGVYNITTMTGTRIR